MIAAASEEIHQSADTGIPAGIKERAASTFAEIARAESQAMRQGMGILATVGATAPFVADLAVAMDETPVNRSDLVRSLDALAEAGREKRIFLRADRGVPYGELMDVLELLRTGGYLKIALVALERLSSAPGKAGPVPSQP